MAQVKPLGFLLAFGIIFLSPQAHAAFGFKLDGTLDKEAISKYYFEGDFGRVLPPLEMYRQSFPASATREDSIFVYKYLSVIYAADSSTRSKGESYMVQLLKLMPTIELIDLYISDNIQAIFKNVKEEFSKQQQYVREHDVYGNAITDSTQRRKEQTPPGEAVKKSGSRKWIWWSVAGAGAVAFAGTVYLALGEDSPGKTPYTFKPE